MVDGPVRVGLLDSGFVGVGPAAVAACRFHLDGDGTVTSGPVMPDSLGHGAALARLIRDAAPDAELLDAQVFSPSGTTAPAVVAAGLHWLVDQGALVVNMSFGLKFDRPVLRSACDAAIRRGVVLVAAVPVHGGPTYPAAYDGVVPVTADGRCPPGRVAHFVRGPAVFGAWPFIANRSHPAGASVAAARVTGRLAGLMAGGLEAGPALARLRAGGIEGPRCHAAVS